MAKKIAALLFVCSCFLPLQAGGGDDLAKLGKARRDAAAEAFKAWLDAERELPGLGGSVVYHMSERWLHAELDLASKKDERTACYASHLQRMKDWRKIFGKEERGNRHLLAMIHAAQIEAEYWLAKERAGK